jgi:hypothetical protein
MLSPNQSDAQANFSSIFQRLFTADKTATYVDVGPRDAFMAGVSLVILACIILMLISAIFVTLGLAYAWFLFKYALAALVKCCVKAATWLLGATVTSGLVLDMSDTKLFDSVVPYIILIISFIELWMLLTFCILLIMSHQTFRRVIVTSCCVMMFIYVIASFLQLSGYKVRVKFRE